MKLYGYWRSSASWRVRIALALKDLPYDYIPINLLKSEHLDADHLSRQPQGLVPAMEFDDGTILTQSYAIIQYLDREFKDNPLRPANHAAAATIEAIALTIACEAQPFGNLRVLQYLKNDLNFDQAQITQWVEQWVGKTLHAAEALLPQENTPFIMGEQPGLGEIFIIPQLFAARRFGANLDAYKRLLAIEKNCEKHPAFVTAHPSQQIDNPNYQQ